MEFLKRPEGASSGDLALLSGEWSVFLPRDLQDFMEASDGPVLWFGFKELQFLPVRDIIRDDYAVQTYMPNALPICLDGNSNICVARVRNRQIVGYYVASCGNLGWDDAVKIADTLVN